MRLLLAISAAAFLGCSRSESAPSSTAPATSASQAMHRTALTGPDGYNFLAGVDLNSIDDAESRLRLHDGGFIVWTEGDSRRREMNWGDGAPKFSVAEIQRDGAWIRDGLEVICLENGIVIKRFWKLGKLHRSESFYEPDGSLRFQLQYKDSDLDWQSE